MGERHVRIEISDFVMRTFVLIKRKQAAVFAYSLSQNSVLRAEKALYARK